MIKISKNWLAHRVFATPQAHRFGEVSLQNSTMSINTSQSTNKTEEMVIEWFKCKLGTKSCETIQKLADAPNFCYTAGPQVGPGSDSKPSK